MLGQHFKPCRVSELRVCLGSRLRIWGVGLGLFFSRSWRLGFGVGCVFLGVRVEDFGRYWGYVGIAQIRDVAQQGIL